MTQKMEGRFTNENPRGKSIVIDTAYYQRCAGAVRHQRVRREDTAVSAYDYTGV